MDSLWRCPECGREFRTKNQWHSCVHRTIESHLEGKPDEVRHAFDRLLEEIRKLGPIRVDAVKSGINLAGRAHFGGVRALKDGLRVGFVLDRKLDDPRILRSEWAGGPWYGHSVKLRSAEELDEQVLGWLGESYELKGRAEPL